MSQNENKMTRKNVFVLIELMRNFLDTQVDVSMYLEKDFDKRWLEKNEEVECDFIGVTNGFLAQVIHAITGYKVEVIGEIEDEMYTCPCCGYKSLTEMAAYDICSYCFWEDDGTVDIHARRAVNHGSIEDYRKKIKMNPNKYYINKYRREEFD